MTNNEEADWTFESLRVVLELHVAALRDMLDERQTNYTSAHDRLQEQVNRLGEAHQFFATRDEVRATDERMAQQIADMSARVIRTEGRGAGLNAFWLYLVAAISTLGAAVTIVILLTGR